MKKKLCLAVFLTTIVCMLGAVACGEDPVAPPIDTGGGNSGPSGELVVPESPAALGNPNLKDLTVYAKDAPEGFYIGNGELVSLTVNGATVATTDFVINEGYLILKAKSWESFGDNTLSFAFDFSNCEDVTITVTVSEADETPTIPGGDLTTKENFSIWNANACVSLTYDDTQNAIVFTKNGGVDSLVAKDNMAYINADYLRLAQENGADCIRFEYQANATLAAATGAGFRFYATETTGLLTGSFDAFTASTEWATATVDIEQFFVANGNAQYFGVVVGGVNGSTLTIKNWRVGTREELNEYRVSTLLPNYGFSEENVSKWSLANPQGLRLGWEDGKGMSLTPQGAYAGLWQRDGMVYTPVTFMKIAKSAGYEGVAFTVTADPVFAEYEPVAYNPALGKGVRVVSKTASGRDDNRIIDGWATGIRQYGDFGVDGSLSFTITIDIDAFFALNPEANYLGLVIATEAGSSLYLSDLTLVEKTGGDTPTPPQESEDAALVAKYGFNQKTVYSVASGGIWDVNAGGLFSKTWDATKNAMAIAMSNPNAGLFGRDFVIYTDISILKEALTAGFKGMTFKVASENGFLDEGRGVRVYSKQTEGRNGDGAGIGNANGGTPAAEGYGTFVYRDFGTQAGVTEFTVTVKIEEFLALNEKAAYFAMVINIPAGTTAYFSDMHFQKTVQTTEAELLEKYGFSQKTAYSVASGGIWDVNAGGLFSKTWDATKNAMAIAMSNPNAGLFGRDFVTYTDISILKEAFAAGFKTFTFKVASENGFLDEGRGVRVYSKQTEGRNGDGAGIGNANGGTPAAEGYGTFVYKDFGTQAGVTEFTVTVNIEEFLALNENAAYFALVINIPAGTTAYFSDMHFTA